MDNSKFNQTSIDYSLSLLQGKVNISTGRLLLNCPLFQIGANNFEIQLSLLYNSQFSKNDFLNKKIGFNNGWKLNVEQYLFPYDNSYHIDNFKQGDYIYIDASWNIHRFIKYKENNEGTHYYDDQFSQLRLLISETTKEIYDINYNRMFFNSNGNIYKIISGDNENIRKTFIYSNGQLIEMYDERKPNRKIEFKYNNQQGLISILLRNNYGVELQSDLNGIKRVDKISKNNKKGLYAFKYNEALEYAIELESMQAFKFQIESNKICEVKKGAMKEAYGYKETSEKYLGDNTFLSDSIFITSCNKNIKGKYYTMPENYTNQNNRFNYEYSYTDLINDKNIVMRYYLNVNNFTSSVLEHHNEESKTIFKTSGFSLFNGGSSRLSINGKHAKTIEDNILYLDNVEEFARTFNDYDNSHENKKKYQENYALSFWIKGNSDIKSTVEVQVFKNSNDIDRIVGNGYLNNTKNNSWQYVTFPISLDKNKDKIKQMYLKFLNNDTELEISDIRIKETTLSELYIEDLKFSLVNQYKYIINGVEYKVNRSSDFFMTEEDVVETYKNMIFMPTNDDNTFDLVCCAGTKKINVSQAGCSCIVDKDDKDQLPLLNKMFSLNHLTEKPNYSYKSINRIDKNSFLLTEIKNNYYIDYDKKYSITETFVEKVDSNLKITDKASHTISEMYLNGTSRKNIDCYGVITSYLYDDYGNIEKIKVSNEKNSLSHETIYGYGDVIPSLREKPLSVTADGITKNYEYEEDIFNIKKMSCEDEEVKYTYDDFYDQTLKVELNEKNNNNDFLTSDLIYNKNGNIKSFQSNKGRTIGYLYNSFGEIVKYYEAKNLVQENYINKSIEQDVITTKVYNNTSTDEKVLPYETIVKFDKHKRMLSKKNEEDEIIYNYQDINESASLSQVKEIVDPYSKQKYIFKYDNDNRPIGYETTGNIDNGANKVTVRQIAANTTQYHFNSDEYFLASKIIKDDESITPNVINPRVIKTKYVDMEQSNTDKEGENYKLFSNNYEYDSLGRMKRKSSDLCEENNESKSSNQEIIYKDNCNYISQISNSYTFVKVDNYKKDYTYLYNNTFDKKGNLKELVSKHTCKTNEPGIVDEKVLLDLKQTYEYDGFSRVIKEKLNDDSLQYIYSKDKIVEVKKNNAFFKKFTYDNGRIKKASINQDEYNITYDNYGNIIYDGNGIINFDSRNYLEQYNTHDIKSSYYYDYQGFRYKKKIQNKFNKTYVNYYLDGSKILKEDHVNQIGNVISSFSYFYDIDGIIGLKYKDKCYNFIKDTTNNIRALLCNDKEIGEYIYDCYGNITIKENDNISNDEKYVLNNNPFRWKSSYQDIETGLYYLNGRYYSPVLMCYLNAKEIEKVNPLDYSNNRYKLEMSNLVNYTFATSNIYTSSKLYVDETYDPIKDKTWFDVNKKKVINSIILIIVLIITLILICNPQTSCLGITILNDGLKAGISGATTVAVKGLVNSIKGNVFIDEICEQMTDAFIIGFTLGTIMSFVSHLNPKTCNYCFKKGTLVLTKEGSKPIEEIKAGDIVYSYNEKTKKKELKKVVRLFKNKTKKWIHLIFSNQEEIICTEEHPFYIKNKGWIPAKNIIEKDKVLMYNNREVELTSKYVERLSVEEDTYNFEVESNHNYYVGESYILAHNQCSNEESCTLTDDVQDCYKKHIPNYNTGSGQKHHIIPKKAFDYLIDNKDWAKGLNRNDYMARAFRLDDHYGYEDWHRELCKYLEEKVKECNSLPELQTLLNKVYSSSDLVSKFGRINIKLIV